MESITIKGCKVHYDPKNISKEAAMEQANHKITEARRSGSRLRSFTAFTAHRGEMWYEELRRLRGRMRRD